MKIWVETEEESIHLRNLLNIAARLYTFIEKEYQEEDIIAETHSLHDLLSENPEILNATVNISSFQNTADEPFDWDN